MSDNDDLIAERDALVDELKDRWPVLAEEMASLLRRVSDDERRTRHAGIASAESIARGVTEQALAACRGGIGEHAHVVRLAMAMIPTLEASDNPNLPATVWPGH